MLWTLIPAKSFAHSKQRLAGLLDEDERARLSAALLAHTVRTAKTAFGDQPVWVVAGSDEVRDAALTAGADRAVLPQASGLNPQLAEAAAMVPLGENLLILHADLPLLETEDLAVLAAADGPVAIAPDHAASGTNALLHHTADRFLAFGPGSCAKHNAEAKARGITPAIVRRRGLERDLDEPADWERLGLTLPELLERLAR